jgi:hypothetical protein
MHTKKRSHTHVQIYGYNYILVFIWLARNNHLAYIRDVQASSLHTGYLELFRRIPKFLW